MEWAGRMRICCSSRRTLKIDGERAFLYIFVAGFSARKLRDFVYFFSLLVLSGVGVIAYMGDIYYLFVPYIFDTKSRIHHYHRYLSAFIARDLYHTIFLSTTSD